MQRGRSSFLDVGGEERQEQPTLICEKKGTRIVLRWTTDLDSRNGRVTIGLGSGSKAASESVRHQTCFLSDLSMSLLRRVIEQSCQCQLHNNLEKIRRVGACAISTSRHVRS